MNLIKVIISMATVVILSTGCASSKKPIRITDQYKPQIERQKTAIASQNGKSAQQAEEEKNRLESRISEVQRLQDEFHAELAAFSDQVKNLTGQANWWGIESMSMKRAGLVAGIGSAALVAASPANAVWIAGLSGFSGAVNGFSASSESEGFSKSVIAAYIQPIVNDVANAAADFSLVEATQHMWSDTSFDKFVVAVKEQQKKINVIKIARIKLRQPVTASDEIMKANQALIKQLTEELNRLRTPNDDGDGNEE